MSTGIKALSCHDIKAVQDTLGQFIEHPWYDYKRITALPANGLEILEQTLQELHALREGEPLAIRLQIQECVNSLKELRGSLAGTRPDPETGYPLRPEQVALYCQAWRSLEKTRRALAITMLDAMGPYMGVIDSGEIQPGGLNLSVDTHRKYAESVHQDYLKTQKRALC